MATRVGIITNVVPSYRQAFYKKLEQSTELSVTVFCQTHLPHFNVKLIHQQFPEIVCLIPFRGTERGLVWQSLPIKRLWQDFDVLVFYGNPRLLSTVLWSTVFRLSRKPVIIWGQVHTAGSNKWFERIRLSWWRLFDYLFVYNDHEAHLLRQSQFFRHAIIGMNNGLDQKMIDAVVTHWASSRLHKWQQERGLDDKLCLLSIARLTQKNRFDYMIEALPKLVEKWPKLRWIVIGAGEIETQLKAQARRNHVDQYIIWTGAIYNEYELAPWLLSAQACVHPGVIGLSLLHVFGYSLPVITHDNQHDQGPEISAFTDQHTGLYFSQNNIDSMIEKINTLLQNPELCREYGQNGLHKVRFQYNIEIMVERFHQIIEATQSHNEDTKNEYE